MTGADTSLLSGHDEVARHAHKRSLLLDEADQVE